jgi:hypothetical protein
MEQDMRFGLILGWLAILKKWFWADYEQLFIVVFHVFRSKAKQINFLKNIVVSALKSCIISSLSFVLNFFWPKIG